MLTIDNFNCPYYYYFFVSTCFRSSYSGVLLKNLLLKFEEIIRDNSESEENPWNNIFAGVKY